MAESIRRLASDLFLIGLTPPIEGFGDFISAWLVTGPEATYLVDVGPAVTANQLTDAITAVGVDHLDYICLTHIHIDHAGAVGHLTRRYPDAVLVCHPKGVPHLIDPQRLWQGSLKTLGATGQAYGRFLPVGPACFASPAQLAAAPFQLLDTPGHSPHHLAIAAEHYLFTGEAGGVSLPLPSGDCYQRPSTPPRFFLETYLESLDRLMAVRPQNLCYGHFGLHTNGMHLLSRHREQLHLWRRTLAEDVTGRGIDSADATDRRVDLLLATDPLLGGFSRLSPAVQTRERGFLRNSVEGFSGYLLRSALH